MCALFRKAGFENASERRITKTMRYKDEEEYLRLVLDGTPLGHSLREEDPSVREEIVRKTVVNLQKWKTGDEIALPAECVIVVANRGDVTS